MHNTGSMKCT